MKKTILLASICLIAIATSAQLTITGNYKQIEKTGVTIIMFDSITNDTKIEYNGTNVRFYKYKDKTVTTDNYSGYLFPPDDATGYIIENEGNKVDTIWVIDHNKYKPDIQSLVPENKPNEQCKDLKIIVNGNVPELYYETPTSDKIELPRYFTITYNTKEWKNDAWADVKSKKQNDIVLPATEIFINEAPLCDTEFSLSGDQYFEMNFKNSKTSTYKAVAVECHIKSTITARSQTNEGDKPANQIPIEYSAPIDIQFLSNGNEPVAQFYKWEILQGKQVIITRTDKDIRQTFDQSGDYMVRLTASNAYCSYADSIEVKVVESALFVPKVFTPNGDGENDEFRVGYKSLSSFQCWVYNRWGRKVYYWSDPQKGWNGTYNGKDAAVGPYFYVIKAVGTDGKKYTRKGDINLLR